MERISNNKNISINADGAEVTVELKVAVSNDGKWFSYSLDCIGSITKDTDLNQLKQETIEWYQKLGWKQVEIRSVKIDTEELNKLKPHPPPCRAMTANKLNHMETNDLKNEPANSTTPVLAVRCNLSKNDEIGLYEKFLDEFTDKDGVMKPCNPDAVFNWFGWQLWRSKQ